MAIMYCTVGRDRSLAIWSLLVPILPLISKLSGEFDFDSHSCVKPRLTSIPVLALLVDGLLISGNISASSADPKHLWN